MIKRTFGLILLLGFLFVPVVSLAEGDVGSDVPDLNPLCWHEEDCLKQDSVFTIQKSGPCKTNMSSGKPAKKSWGKCTPLGKVETKIAVGGQNTFQHIGEYMLVIYNYALAVVGILAVAVIIVGGLQWLTSAGNSDTITRSKTRIFGALIGLLIAYTSFIILGNINPDFVNLRMPQVWMLRPKQALPEKCIYLPDLTKALAPAAKADNQIKAVKKTGEEKFEYSYEGTGGQIKHTFKTGDDKTKGQFQCGKRFFVEGAGESTCFSTYCKGKDACVPFGPNETPPRTDEIYICKQSSLFGTISYAGSQTKNTDWNLPKITKENKHELWALCKEGTMKQVPGDPETSTNNVQKNQGWNFVTHEKAVKEVVDYCKKYGAGFVGFVVEMPMNEDGAAFSQDHWIGVGGKDLGKNGTFFDLGGFAYLLHEQRLKKGFYDMNSRCFTGAQKSVCMDERNVLSGRVAKDGLKYWDVRVDPIHFIDPSWTSLGKGNAIEIDINADYVYDVNIGWTSDAEDAAIVQAYTEILQSKYQSQFKGKPSNFSGDLTNYPQL